METLTGELFEGVSEQLEELRIQKTYDDSAVVVMEADTLVGLTRLKKLVLLGVDFEPSASSLMDDDDDENGNRRFRAHQAESSMEELQLVDTELAPAVWSCVQRLSNLRKLHLCENEIDKVEPDMFANLSQLELLDLSDNHITAVQDGSFAALRNLKVLDLSGNQLKSINYAALQGTTKTAAADTKFDEFELILNKMCLR